MFNFDSNWLQTFLLIFGLCCFLPMLIGMIAAIFAINRLSRWIMPDTEQMQRDFARLEAANSDLDRERLIRKIIHQQAIKTGLIGAITGLGGFITIPIALPIDLYTSARIQAAMVTFIAYAYGHTESSATEEQLKTLLVVSGGSRVTRTTTRLVLDTLTRFLGKTLAKFIPLIGAVIGFAVNYAIAQSTGRIAARWYAGQQKPPTV